MKTQHSQNTLINFKKILKEPNGTASSLLQAHSLVVAQTVKNLPAVQETQVQSLNQKDPLQKGMVTHCSILVWRILWTEEPGGL